MLAGCEENKGQASIEEAKPKIEQKFKFSPPSDNRVTDAQLRNFVQAEAALSEVSRVLIDSLSEAVNAERSRVLRLSLQMAKEMVARKFNLLGQEEYEWLLTEAPKNPANQAAYKRLNISIVQ